MLGIVTGVGQKLEYLNFKLSDMIKISVYAIVVHLMVDDTINLSLRLSNDSYVDFPIYDESFPLVKAGKKFRLTLEEVETNEADGPIDTLPKFGKVGDMLRDPRNSSARIRDVEEDKKPYPITNVMLAETSKWDGKTPYHIIDELRRDVAALGTIKKALNQLEVRNEERLASYPDPEIEAHRKHLQEAIMSDTKKVDELIAGTAGEVDEVVNKGPFCDGCKHIGVNTESGPCNVCFEGMMYESDK